MNKQFTFLLLIIAMFILFFLSCSNDSESNTTPESTITNSTSTTIPFVSVNNRLLITEVGGLYYSNSSAWIEVFNDSNSEVDLSNYQIRTNGRDRVSPYTQRGVQIFDIPSIKLYPGAYALIRGKLNDDLLNGDRIVYILNENIIIPTWFASGFVELLKNSETVDFVRFGSNSISPLTEQGWSGSSTTDLSTDYAKSIARLLEINNGYIDTNTKDDWTSRDFATPGGPNDITSFEDLDGDGIPDCAEVEGGTFAGLPLYEWGARVNQKDIFIHIDYMDSTDPGIIPQKAALDKLVEVFGKKGFWIHFDVGDLFGTGLYYYNLDNNSHRVPYNKSVTLGDEYGKANLYNYKNSFMALQKRQIFHYLLMGSSQNLDGSAGSSGYAEIDGNDILITLGNWELTTEETANYTASQNRNRLINYQAATIMHELGHNLGLEHGGDEKLNYKPNYLSIMNYMYQLDGLPKIGSEKEGDRYYWYRYADIDEYSSSSLFKKYISRKSELENSPFTSTFILDYSNGLSGNINEGSIDENIGLCRTGSNKIDFNGNGTNIESGYSYNLNPSEGSIISVFNDYDDWSNLNLFFMREWSGDTSGARADDYLNIFPDKIGDDRQRLHKETNSKPRD